ncbi:MAG: transcription termination factor NusA [Bacteroidota bacterium]
MTKIKTQSKLEGINLVESFAEFKEIKNIDRVTLISILEDVFRGAIRKKFNTDANFDIIVSPDKDGIEIWHNRQIVNEEFSKTPEFDPGKHIKLEDAHKIDPDFQIGEDVAEALSLNSFERRTILTIRQNLVARILDLEKEIIYNKYKDRIGEIITGEIYQIWKREILVHDDESNELIMPKSEQIPSDFFKKGDNVRAVIQSVEMKNNNPIVILSRTSSAFLERLFELEVPEIFDGLITIKKIVREPGERAKVAVESYDDRIDPVGACVGIKGSRIHGIVRELKNENIDVINFTNNTQLLIQRSLSPAKITSIKLDEEKKRAEVYLKPDQISLAIGKGGHNIRLAGKLTGYELDVYRDVEEEIEDIDLDEFSEEIENWIIDELKRIGCDTARSVIDLNTEDLVKRTELEEVTINEVKRILKAEFE